MPYGPGSYRDDEIPDNYIDLRNRGYGPQPPQRNPLAFDWRQLLYSARDSGLGALDRGAMALSPYANAIQRRILALRGGRRQEGR